MTSRIMKQMPKRKKNEMKLPMFCEENYDKVKEKLSPEGIELLELLLHEDPNKRIGAFEALEH
jgi:hypothetical protein